MADSSLEFDRLQKGSLYAKAGIRDYWIVNTVDRVLEIYRDPGPDASAPHGWRYLSEQQLAPAHVAIPLALPSVRIAVSALLP